MSGDIKKLLELERKLILKERKRLGLLNNDEKTVKEYGICYNEHQSTNKNVEEDDDNEKEQQSIEQIENKENVQSLNLPPGESTINHNKPLINEKTNNFTCNNDGAIEERKQAFIDKLIHSENPFYQCRSDDKYNIAMLRYGEYSPNNPQLRVNAAPYIGLGEYEQRRNYFLQKQRADYLEHLAKQNQQYQKLTNAIYKEYSNKSTPSGSTKTIAVQTDIQNIRSRLVQYELESQNHHENESRNSLNSIMQNCSYNRVDQRLTSAQNALLKRDMDKPKSILSNRRTGSPRERLLSDLKHSYTPSFMDGFSYQDKAEELQRERMKRETYQQELRLQIEEKRRLQAMRDEQDRREQELENKRLEQQLLRMQEEAMIEENRRTRRDEMRRHSEDLLRRKHELQTRHLYHRKHTDSESSVLSLRNTNVASTKALSHYSPPIQRRNPYSFNIPSTSLFSVEPQPASSRYNLNRYDTYYRKDALNRMDSLTTTSSSYDGHFSSTSNNRYNAFNRYDSLSRIDSLNRQDTLNRLESLTIHDNLSNIQRRHSATQQDLSMIRKSPKLQRRSSSSRFDDSLPIPVLKAHSPVAKELKNSVPFNSSRSSSDAVRKLEDKWQIPAVQKNILNHGDCLRDRSILTQLGAIRMQLQQEQLRMDETLRKRGFTQSKAVDFH